MIHKNPPYFTVISSDKLILFPEYAVERTVDNVSCREEMPLCDPRLFFRYAKLFLALFVYINYFPVLCLLHNKRKGASP